MKKQLTLQQKEAQLEQKFLNKTCSFSYPGYNTVYGKIDTISIDTLKLSQGLKEVLFQMNGNQYSVSLESLNDCLKLL